ncbi:hypothetical protein Q9Q95_11200 [Sphingomonas sp. DG1-23]|uniref:hypothetical protein n=1 Tax=Sphingomonas sp. DG1-23 TaxID=3068316 RepID=UPI00273E5889|nr:hypothetical protein [Sphingomonas sp. DG1-23]MDP5279489.1 hypothetical protein [Sphingomonas sp. DG1-23]
MFKKLAVIAAASSMMLATTAAQANSASALSLRNAPAAEARASTMSQKDSKLLPGGPLFAIIGIVAVVALLEVTKVINIFGDDEPDSP